MAADPVTAIAILLSQVFGFVVDPDGLEQMKREHEIELLQAGIRIAAAEKNHAVVDALFVRFRMLSQKHTA